VQGLLCTWQPVPASQHPSSWRTLIAKDTNVNLSVHSRHRERRAADYLMCIPEIALAITSCWISAVPSKMS
jgi:hypothetical protein